MAAHSSILSQKFHGQWSLVGCSPWGLKESDMTERTHHTSSYENKCANPWCMSAVPLRSPRCCRQLCMWYGEKEPHWHCDSLGAAATTRLLCLWDFLGKNTALGCHFLLQGIFLTQGLNLYLLCWQAGSSHWTTREAPVFNSQGDYIPLKGFYLWFLFVSAWKELVKCQSCSFSSFEVHSLPLIVYWNLQLECILQSQTHTNIWKTCICTAWPPAQQPTAATDPSLGVAVCGPGTCAVIWHHNLLARWSLLSWNSKQQPL